MCLRAQAPRASASGARLGPAAGKKGGLPVALARLDRLLGRGLQATAPFWPPIEIAYGWVHRAAHLLANAQGQDGFTIQEQYMALLGEMAERRHEVGSLPCAIDHLLKVTASYAPGLFPCYEVADLPPDQQ
jgi:hypothetical protein